MTMCRPPALCLAAGLLVLLSGAGPLQAQEGDDVSPAMAAAAAHGAPHVTAERLPVRVSLDGRLDEPEWLQVTPVTEFTQTEPVDGARPSQRTEVRIMYDDEALYVGARMWDDAGGVRTRLGRRDSYLSDSDWFYVMLDSHHDHLTAYQFSVNPAGVKRDERTSGGMRGDDSWDAVWDAATSVDAEGWTAELRIPFSQLRFGAAESQVWGLQLSRRINRNQEVLVLAWTPKGEPGGVARYAHLEGLRDLRTGRRLELQPYVMTRAEYVSVAGDDPFRDGSDYFGGAGVDLKYRLTSSLTLDATLNPDFGQVEVDPAVVNLSAFETSYQEKRPFFIEGRDVFSFGDAGGGPGGGGSGNQRGLFYSRRIGRAPQGGLPSGVRFAEGGDAATILGAAKLTGRTANGLSMGLLGALTGAETARWVRADDETGTTLIEPRTGYLVGRLRQDLRAGQTSLGGIMTAVQRDLAGEPLSDVLRSRAITGGVDLEHLFLGRTWAVEGHATFSHVSGTEAALLRTQLASSRYYARPDADHLDVDSARTALSGYSTRLELAKRAGLHWRGNVSVSSVSPGYEVNDAGFQTTVDRRGASASVTYVENQPGRIFRNYRVTTSANGEWNHGGDILTARNSLNLNGQFANYWGGMLSFTRGMDTWSDRLTRGGPLTRDIGGYNVSANLNSDGRNPLSGRLSSNYSWDHAGSWNQRASLNLTLRPADNWTVSAGPRLDRSQSPAQYLTARTDSSMSATYGRRYLFSQLRQNTVSMETRLNVNFTPDLSVELFAQPFLSTGDYGDPAQLRAPRTYDFDVFGTDVGTLAYDDDSREYVIDPDGAGPASEFRLRDRDFTTYSLRGNAVLRWEWRAGSTLYLVWQQRRAGSTAQGDFDFGRDAQEIFRQRPDNVLVMKVNYWLNL
jgi:hypothetical protein